ncbi:MAG TPA: CPBP family intramembrane glutamic endopeptidase, partial [Acidobacteriota bacterium]|nr:CPBP family intramembrane glutamic endopeptidase [Acidobacteriota bacterium]
MTGGRSRSEYRLVGAAGALAAILFMALFRLRRLGPLDFWTWMTLNVVIVVALAFLIDGGYAQRLRQDLRSGLLRKAVIGIASAGVLYAVFAIGRFLALRIFPFAGAGIGNVYALRAGVPVLRVVLLIAFVIGPGEELFWRGFFQERTGATTSRAYGFALTALLYAAVHLASGNIMLTLAAAVCGVFWGWLYLRFR